MTNEEKKAFYARCGKILGIKHNWNTPVKKRTRWNTRRIGNGRFPGYGLIRVYGDSIMVINRQGSKMYSKAEEVYQMLEEEKNGSNASSL